MALHWMLLQVIGLMASNAVGECPTPFGYEYEEGRWVTPTVSVPSCYLFVRPETSWVKARYKCIGIGGELASLETKGESDHLDNIIRQNSSLQQPELTPSELWGYWVSGTNLPYETQWYWSATLLDLEFTNWAPGEPNNIGSGPENCMQLKQTSDWKWNDAECNLHLSSYICETDARL